jgi:class 3 adenylate cyclase
MKCVGCQSDNPKFGHFCTHCGATLPIECTSCGEINYPESNFCGGCGTRLARLSLVGRPTDLNGSNSGSLTGLELLSPATAEGERRHLTVLFCDMVGSTTLANSLDLEELSEITRNFYGCCADAIRRFEGIVANYLGDGVMALFGYPRAHEDDAERAIRAGLSLVRMLENSGAASKWSVSARVGIATGLVVVGEDGVDGLTREKTVVGETPNFAANLQSATEPNTVIISKATRRLVGDVFRVAEVKLANLKGAKEPLTAWRVVAEKVAQSRFATHVVSLTSFVGREQEVALLSDRWQQATFGEGQVVLLGGEAGIGKSRVVETFRGLIAKTPHTAMYYQCSPYHTDTHSTLSSLISRMRPAS